MKIFAVVFTILVAFGMFSLISWAEAPLNPWRPGPLPKGTYNWGGVVTRNDLDKDGKPLGFNFADFRGDHVEILDGKRGKWIRVEAADVVYWSNSLTWPPVPGQTNAEKMIDKLEATRPNFPDRSGWDFDKMNQEYDQSFLQRRRRQ